MGKRRVRSSGSTDRPHNVGPVQVSRQACRLNQVDSHCHCRNSANHAPATKLKRVPLRGPFSFPLPWQGWLLRSRFIPRPALPADITEWRSREGHPAPATKNKKRPSLRGPFLFSLLQGQDLVSRGQQVRTSRPGPGAPVYSRLEQPEREARRAKSRPTLTLFGQ